MGAKASGRKWKRWAQQEALRKQGEAQAAADAKEQQRLRTEVDYHTARTACPHRSYPRMYLTPCPLCAQEQVVGVIEAKAAARKWRHWVAEARSKRDESESRQLDHWCVQSYVYRKADGASSGPICIGELQEMLAEGTLTPDTVRSHTQTRRQTLAAVNSTLNSCSVVRMLTAVCFGRWCSRRTSRTGCRSARSDRPTLPSTAL